MTIQYFTKFVRDVGAGSNIDFNIGGNGGILLSASLFTAPKTYFNANTSNESVQPGDIHALIIDTLAARSLIGQTEVSPIPDAIVIPVNNSWEWEHQNADAFRNSQIVSKLRPYTTFTVQPTTVIVPGGAIRVIAAWDVNRKVVHHLAIELEVLVFD